MNRAFSQSSINNAAGEVANDDHIAADPAHPTKRKRPRQPRIKAVPMGDHQLSQSAAWTVTGLLPESGLAMLYGASNVGKSFLSLDLACALASGSPWFGCSTLPSTVIYVAAEGVHGLRGRVSAWRLAHERPIPESLMLVADGIDLSKRADTDDLVWLAEDLLEANPEFPRHPVFIIDTLASAMPGADENSATDMGRVVHHARELAKRTGGLVFLVHHSGKDSDRGPRGHSLLLAAVDTAIQVSGSSTAALRAWRVVKSRDGESGLCASFALKVVELDGDESQPRCTSCVVEPASEVSGGVAAGSRHSASQEAAAVKRTSPMPSGYAGKLMKVVSELTRQRTRRMPLKELRERFIRECVSGMSSSSQRTAWSRARTALESQGLLRVSGDSVEFALKH